MVSNEFLAECKERVSLWKEEKIHDTVVEDYVMSYLPDVDEKEYELYDLLSTDTVDMLLKKGALQLKCLGHGGVSMISNGRVVDRSHLGPRYRVLIDRWVLRGWIRLAADGSITRI